MPDPENPASKLWRLIGDTPLIAIRYRYQDGPEQEVFVKCEQYNLTGSIKDRVALYTIEAAARQGMIKPGDLLVEESCGNSGISYAAIGKALGYRVRVVMPAHSNLELRAMVKSHGAEVQLGELSKTLLRLPQLAVEVHEKTTGREISRSLMLEDRRPAAFVCGMGSGNTMAGIAKYLCKLYPELFLCPVEPVAGKHRISGISNGRLQSAAAVLPLEQSMKVHDGDAVLMAQTLTRVGLEVGVSSGANLVAAIRLQQTLPGGKAIVTLFPDNNKRYAFAPEPVKDDYTTPRIKLLGYRVLAKI